MITLIAGYNTTATVECTGPNGEQVNFATASSVQAVIYDEDTGLALTSVYTCLIGTTGANWATGLVAVNVLGADTLNKQGKNGKWEVKVVVAGITTAYIDQSCIKFVKGHIP